MDKKIAGLLGAAAALTAMQSVQASAAPATEPATPATYRDLLEPVPNALSALKNDDARIAQARDSRGVEMAQFIVRDPYRYRRYHHHHHHHHHHGFHFYVR